MVTSRFTGSGRAQEGGFLGTHKQDFEAHRTGGDWRHDATQTDMNPTIPAFPGATVHETLDLMAAGFTAITGLESVLALNNSAGAQNIVMNGNFVRNMANPTNPQDAATKFYVDAAVSGLGLETLAETLALGNATAGNDIDFTGGSVIFSSEVSADISITAGTGNAVLFGGELILSGGTGGGPVSAGGGDATLSAGSGGATGDGGDLTLSSGGSGAGAASGDVQLFAAGGAAGCGSLQIYTSSGGAGTGGAISIYTANSGGGGDAGDISLTTGNGAGIRLGGDFTVLTGNAGSTARAGNITLQTGTASTSSTGDAGTLSLRSGNAGSVAGANAGDISLKAGNAIAAGTSGGDVIIESGNGSGAGTFPGDVLIRTGDGSGVISGAISISTDGGNTGGSGDIDIFTGSGSGGNSGSLSLTTGAKGALTQAGNLYLTAGGTVAAPFTSGVGDIFMTTGYDAGTSGNVQFANANGDGSVVLGGLGQDSPAFYTYQYITGTLRIISRVGYIND